MIPAEMKEKLDNTIWSYSRIGAFVECPYCFLKHYVEREPEIDNAFAQWGTLMHSLIENQLTGKLEINDLVPEYRNRFKTDITEEFPPSFRGSDMGKGYFDDGVAFLLAYEGMSDRYELLGCEIETLMEIEGYKFTGFIDLLIRKKDTGELIIVDHKSKRNFKSKRERAEYARQLYLYSKWVHDKYGMFPSKLVFNLIRGEKPDIIRFNVEDFRSTLGWATSTIRSIYTAVDFPTKLAMQARKKHLNAKYAPPDYFCEHICGMRNNCPAMGTRSEDE